MLANKNTKKAMLHRGLLKLKIICSALVESEEVSNWWEFLVTFEKKVLYLFKDLAIVLSEYFQHSIYYKFFSFSRNPSKRTYTFFIFSLLNEIEKKKTAECFRSIWAKIS